PLYWMVNTSFKTNKTAYRIPPDFLPNPPTLENYIRLVNEDVTIMRFFFNSLVIGFGTVFFCLLFGGLAGYSLSRFQVPGKRIIMIFILLSQLFPLAVLLIPLYIHFSQIGLLDTYWAVITAHTAITLPYSVWLLKGFIDTIPMEIEEAAAIDGCSRIGILLRIIINMIAPGMITVAVTSFLMSFREFLYALTLTSTPASRPISPGLQVYFMAVMSLRWANLMAATVLAIIPVIIIYVFLQKYVVSGLTGGAVKG
ncbi:MAG TPA: carbohydrate ABC transporter permease, partial [Spirochaetia bacterium]|nr:carbohydrate ABC transporter permease [Spirochaetia bacterium]